VNLLVVVPQQKVNFLLHLQQTTQLQLVQVVLEVVAHLEALRGLIQSLAQLLPRVGVVVGLVVAAQP
jgi:hypothetical protein